MTRLSILALLCSCLASLAPGPLAGQGDPGLEPGTRIRVTAPSVYPGRAVGQLQTIDATGLRMSLQGDGDLTVPRDAVSRIDVSEGNRSHWVRGAAIGGLVGLTTGVIAVVAAESSDEELELLPGFDTVVETTAVIVMTVVGAGAGALIGALIRTEQWKPVPAAGVQWGLLPRWDGGVGLVVTLRL